MRIDTGLRNVKSAFAKALNGLQALRRIARKKRTLGSAFSPNIPKITGEKLIPNSDNVEPPRSRPSPTKGKIDVKRALFNLLFPDLETGQRFVEDQHNIIGKKMKSHIQFLTTPTSDTPGTSLLLHFDDKRYLIGNMHEGVQRAGIQVGARFTKVQDIFLTGKIEWQTIGGLFGLVLTLADSTAAASSSLVAHAKEKLERERARSGDGATQPPRLPSAADIHNSKTGLNIHGGPNLLHLFATARMFIFRKGVPLRVLEHEGKGHTSVSPDRDPDWTDDNIRVWKMAITNTATASSPKSPRKRSFTEYAETGSLQDLPKVEDNTAESSDSHDRHQEVRRNVVSEMFESSWRLDSLEEVPLSKVSGPAVMFIRDPETNKLQRYIPPPDDGNTPLPNINVLIRKAWPGALVDTLPKSVPSPIAMSYIIRNHRQRGKFLASKAKDLNVPLGPLFSKLANGENVLSAEGMIVTPDMVLGPAKEGGGVAVIDLPTKDFVENLINRPEWESQGTMAGVGAVLWMLGKDVSQDTRIQAFMKHHPQWKHIISSPDSCPNYLAMSSSGSSAIRLNRLNRNFFPIPAHDNSLPLQHDGLPCGGDVTGNVVAAQRGLMCQLEPKFEIQETAIVPHLQTGKLLENMPKYALELAQAAREEIAAEFSQSNVNQALPSPNAEIITLGTGSALPSKYRNVSATLLRVPGCGSYLLDCGENTLGQLKRVYGDEDLKEVLRDLKLIWISHLHADHHLGTVSVIKAWRDEVHGQADARDDSQTSNQLEEVPLFSSVAEIANPIKVLQDEKRLIITGSGQMMKWLQEYAGVEHFGYDKIIPLESAAPWGKHSPRFHLKWHHRHVGFGKEYPKISEALQKATGLSNLAAVQVPHCWNAQAVTLTFPTGFKFSYSGDCRPSKEFVKIGKGSTVLVHEATFDDELQGDAEAKKHSTTSEAIGVGMAMGAKRVVLTHFSQRYQKIPVMENMGFMGVRLEDAEEIGEADTPIVDADLDDKPSDTTQEDVIMQIEDDAAEKGSLNANGSSQQNNGASSEPRVSSSHPLRSPITSSRPVSSDPGQSETRPSVVFSPVAINDMKICVAFDYMRVKVSEIAHMEKYTPALLELYQQEDVDEKDASTQEQLSNESEKKNKREDESDDEARRGEQKKNNEEINRGKSKRQLRKEQRERKRSDTRKEEERGKQPNDAIESESVLPPTKNLSSSGNPLPDGKRSTEQEQGKKPNDAIESESVLPPTKNLFSSGNSSPNGKRSTVEHQEYQAEKVESDALINCSAIHTSDSNSSVIGIPLKGQKSWNDLVKDSEMEASKITREGLAWKDVDYENLKENLQLIRWSITQTHHEIRKLDKTMAGCGWGPLLTVARTQSYHHMRIPNNLPTTPRKRSPSYRRSQLRRLVARRLADTHTAKIPSPSSSESQPLCSSDSPATNLERPTAKVPRIVRYLIARSSLIRRYTSERRFENVSKYESVRRTSPTGRSPLARPRKPGATKAPAPRPIKISTWDSMLANVAREIDVDLMEANQHGRASKVKAH